MNEYLASLERDLSPIEGGFKEEERRARSDYDSHDRDQALEIAYCAYRSEVYQVRMYAVFLFGYLSQDQEVLTFLRENIAQDDNWRVQEILAKAFDFFCATTGYEHSLSVIDEWLAHSNPNVRRAVTEGLRIWTSRPDFKEHPCEAIKRLSALRNDPSEYVRKSVGNALRDISKRFPDLVATELSTWDLESKETRQVHKLASKFIERDAAHAAGGAASH